MRLWDTWTGESLEEGGWESRGPPRGLRDSVITLPCEVEGRVSFTLVTGESDQGSGSPRSPGVAWP